MMGKANFFLTFPFIFIFLNLLESSNAWDKFCSVYCSGQNCLSNATNNCSVCISPWTYNSSTKLCTIYNSSGYVLGDTSDDITDGTISTTDASFTGSCPSNSSSWSYSFFGNQTGNSPITFSASGIQTPHFAIRIFYWMIQIDWGSSNNDNIYTTLNSVSNIQTITKSRLSGNRVASERVCGNWGNTQSYWRFDGTYLHNDSDPFTINITTNNSGSSGAKWGLKQLIVLVQFCHWACGSCYGPFATQCYSCDDDFGMKLSNHTCNQSCLSGFGQTDAGNICVFCNPYCVVCYNDANNCTQCRANGTYASFLLTINNTCVATCPVGMYGNYTDRVCYDCDPTCTSCRSNATYCYGCVTALGYAWNNYVCYNPCPLGTFLSANQTNCTKCHNYCIQCLGPYDNCTSCTLSGIYQAYLLNTTCYKNCPAQYYPDSANGTVNTCQPCDASCYLCTGNPTPCSQCNPFFYLYNSTCGTTCPSEYFTYNATWTCLLCSQYCVSVTMKMYFPDATNQKLYIELKFSDNLDFENFPYQTFQTIGIDSDMYNMDMFTLQYVVLSSNTYRIIMEPKGFIFLYNATITCTTMNFPGTFFMSSDGKPFKLQNYAISDNIIWFVIKAPDMSVIQQQIINTFSNASNALSNFTTLPYVQEIKKAGLFMFLFPAAQITSATVLVNNIPSQNLYEGVRFWAMFVFFDVPQWQKNSNKIKYVVVHTVQSLVQNSRLLHQIRRLFNIYSIEWRFSRVGQTSYFIFDTYPIIVLLLVCWIFLIIGYCMNKKKPVLFRKHAGKFFTLLHKAHQISILYIMLATIMEWLYFQPNLQRFLSLGLCILANLYFLVYELYIYYDLIKYPAAVIGSQKYEYYAISHGSYLKHIRFVEYDLKEPWSPKHWFRPYNYHILSFYKKFMMIASLPLFYHITHAQAGVLLILQSFEMIRFVASWPFLKAWRNIYRLVLECALEMFFICIFIQGFLVQQIMLNNPNTIKNTIQSFYRFGWIGFGMVFFFNCGFIALGIYDTVIGCRKSNREMMDEARRTFYYNKLKTYEQENEEAPLGLVNKWVKLGNLNKRDYDELPDVNVRVEFFRIGRVSNGDYQIELNKVTDIFMNIELNFSKDNNISIGQKINKKFILNRQLSKDFYYMVDSIYRKYEDYNVQYLTLKTFQRIEQSLYKPGDRIELKRNQMKQKIVVQMYSGQKKVVDLDKLLDGFPISTDDLAVIP